MNPGDIILPINRAIFPAGFCGDSQSIANFIAENMEVILPSSISFFVTQSSEPTVENRGKIWIKTNSSDGSIIGQFSWSPTWGVWLMNKWMMNGGAPPFSERRLFVGQSSDVDTFDGGETGSVTLISGPFWAIDSAFVDKIPIGPGTFVPLPNTTNPVFAVGVSDPKVIGTFFLRPTGRIFVRGS